LQAGRFRVAIETFAAWSANVSGALDEPQHRNWAKDLAGLVTADGTGARRIEQLTAWHDR